MLRALTVGRSTSTACRCTASSMSAANWIGDRSDCTNLSCDDDSELGSPKGARNGWRLERYGRRLVDPHEAPVSLTKGEYALLLAFLEAPERPLSREHLLNATRVHEDIFDRSVDVQVLRLRRKLEIDPNAPPMIHVVEAVIQRTNSASISSGIRARSICFTTPA